MLIFCDCSTLRFFLMILTLFTGSRIQESGIRTGFRISRDLSTPLEVTQQNYSVTASQHHSVTKSHHARDLSTPACLERSQKAQGTSEQSQHHSVTTSLRHSITASLHHNKKETLRLQPVLSEVRRLIVTPEQ